MSSCWEAEPSKRPTFSELVSQISSVLYEIKDYLPLVSTPQESSCNGTGNHTLPGPSLNGCTTSNDLEGEDKPEIRETSLMET